MAVHSLNSNIKAVLLVGGMGTRLRSVVPNAPKPMASLGSRSFLELLVLQLRAQGIRRLVMCTGYLSEQIEEQFGDGRNLDIAIEYSKELQPLGTAGAVKLADPLLQGVSEFLVMNGDSFIEIDFHKLIRFHHEHGGLASIAVRRVDNANRYGMVHADASGRITTFAEKTSGEAPGLINAGVYVFSSAVLGHIPKGPASLEKDVFPKLLNQGMYALEYGGMFIDIGTPEDYVRAQELSERLYQAASLKN